MATRTGTVEFPLEQGFGAGSPSAKGMLEAYERYREGKLVASVRDDQLHLKPTDAAFPRERGRGEALSRWQALLPHPE